MLFPFRLAPIYKDYVWGGKRLRPEAEITAEAWIVYEGDTILDGIYAGQTLAQACETNAKGILGSKRTGLGNRFPLLIKLLDCQNWLSLQVHPNDEQAARLEGPSHYGKTEAWYVIDAEKDAELISGFRSGVTCEDIQRTVGTKDLLDLVERRKVKPGEAVFMAPGTIHALGAGLLIYEVQQNSDITYRAYDWDRPSNGERKLHIEQSIAVLNPAEDGKIISRHLKSKPLSRQILVSCDYFTLELLNGQGVPVEINTHGDSFAALTALNEMVRVSGKDWNYQLNPLETLFIPADCDGCQVDLTESASALLAYCS